VLFGPACNVFASFLRQKVEDQLLGIRESAGQIYRQKNYHKNV
jgi:hypothetical protein